jgi:hypothetical protein
MGSYLYSANPSIGDVTVVHAQGWNFGGNSAGHGEGRALAIRRLAHPTLLDAAPTILAWLGLGETALADFERGGFPEHLQAWVAAQRADILGNLDEVENLNQALREAGFSKLRVSRFRERLARLLAFLPDEPPTLPDPASARADGNLLVLE